MATHPRGTCAFCVSRDFQNSGLPLVWWCIPFARAGFCEGPVSPRERNQGTRELSLEGATACPHALAGTSCSTRRLPTQQPRKERREGGRREGGVSRLSTRNPPDTLPPKAPRASTAGCQPWEVHAGGVPGRGAELWTALRGDLTSPSTHAVRDRPRGPVTAETSFRYKVKLMCPTVGSLSAYTAEGKVDGRGRAEHRYTETGRVGNRRGGTQISLCHSLCFCAQSFLQLNGRTAHPALEA